MRAWGIVAVAVCVAASTARADGYMPPPKKEIESTAKDTAPCVSHPDMDLAAFEEAFAKVPNRGTPFPLGTFLPKGLVVKNVPAKFTPTADPSYRGTGSEAAFLLPDYAQVKGGPLSITDGEHLWIADEYFPRGYIATSPCRVQDPKGRWWVVFRDVDGKLSYYNWLDFDMVEK